MARHRRPSPAFGFVGLEGDTLVLKMATSDPGQVDAADLKGRVTRALALAEADADRMTADMEVKNRAAAEKRASQEAAREDLQRRLRDE